VAVVLQSPMAKKVEMIKAMSWAYEAPGIASAQVKSLSVTQPINQPFNQPIIQSIINQSYSQAITQSIN